MDLRPLLFLLTLGLAHFAAAHPRLELLDVRQVWNQAPHNAFTSLTRFQDKWFLSFREAGEHAVPKPGEEPGKARVLVSEDGKKWASTALLSAGPDLDVRDPKLLPLQDGRLLLTTAVRPHRKGKFLQSLAWLSSDGQTWEGPHPIGEPDNWLWRVTQAPDGTLWGVGYGPIVRHPRRTKLFRAEKGTLDFKPWVDPFNQALQTAEASLIFLSDGTAAALVRQDGHERSARLGFSSGDLKQWNFHRTGVRIGGPHLLELPGGHLLGAGRRRFPTRTSLFWINRGEATLEPGLDLPSAGDSSYPGLTFHDGRLWVSYYSTHQGDTSAIYLAEIKVHPDPTTSQPQPAPLLTPGLHAKALGTLHGALNTYQFWPAIHAAEGLIALNRGHDTHPLLIGFLQKSKDPKELVGAARELVRSGERAPLTLIQKELNDPHSPARIHAAETLFKLDLASVEKDTLTQLLAPTTNPLLRTYAAAALARQDHPEALALAREAAAQPSSPAHQAALFCLIWLAQDSDLPLLQKAFASPDPALRLLAAISLARLQQPAARTHLRQSLQSPDPALRARAAEGYTLLNPTTEEARDLLDLLDDPESDPRIRAAHALLLRHPQSTP